MGSYQEKEIGITAESFQTCPEFSSLWYSQNYLVNFLNFEFPILNDFFFKKIQIHQCTLCRKQTRQLSGKRAIEERNGVKFWDSHAIL